MGYGLRHNRAPLPQARFRSHSFHNSRPVYASAPLHLSFPGHDPRPAQQSKPCCAIHYRRSASKRVSAMLPWRGRRTQFRDVRSSISRHGSCANHQGRTSRRSSKSIHPDRNSARLAPRSRASGMGVKMMRMIKTLPGFSRRQPGFLLNSGRKWTRFLTYPLAACCRPKGCEGEIRRGLCFFDMRI
jgi:hypothetical protein